MVSLSSQLKGESIQPVIHSHQPAVSFESSFTIPTTEDHCNSEPVIQQAVENHPIGHDPAVRISLHRLLHRGLRFFSTGFHPCSTPTRWIVRQTLESARHFLQQEGCPTGSTPCKNASSGSLTTCHRQWRPKSLNRQGISLKPSRHTTGSRRRSSLCSPLHRQPFAHPRDDRR